MIVALSAEEYFQIGLEKYDQGLLEEAIADWTEAIRLDPNDAVAYMNRGAARSELGDKQGAILDYDEAIELNSNYTLAYTNRGAAKAELGDKQGAILDYDKAIELDPNLALAYGNRGLVFEEIGEIFEAQLDFRRFLYLTNKVDFFRAARFVFPYFSTYPAPYLLHRSLQKFTGDFEQFNTVHPIVDATRQQCRPWKVWEEWRRLTGSEKHEALAHYHALALVNHYMGDCIEAFRIYDEVLDNEAKVGVPLNFLGQLLTAAGAGAAVKLFGNFWVARHREDLINMDEYSVSAKQLTAAPDDFDLFVDNFLRFMSYQRETLGEEKFEERYPLEGFEDWKRKW
ncbi:MAG: tetratricopeptide repeat protein [Lewinellaceae bacterium]|nr:tetratricopeptide repeat protein [Lewinellaceae bacterium]